MSRKLYTLYWMWYSLNCNAGESIKWCSKFLLKAVVPKGQVKHWSMGSYFLKVSADIPAALGIGSNTNSVIPLNIEISPQWPPSQDYLRTCVALKRFNTYIDCVFISLTRALCSDLKRQKNEDHRLVLRSLWARYVELLRNLPSVSWVPCKTGVPQQCFQYFVIDSPLATWLTQDHMRPSTKLHSLPKTSPSTAFHSGCLECDLCSRVEVTISMTALW